VDIEDVELPVIDQVSRRINSSPNEVFSPRELNEDLGISFSSIHSALLSLVDKGEVERAKFSNKSYYGTEEAIKKLEEELEV